MRPDAPFHADVASAPDGARASWLTAADGVRLRAVAWSGGTRGTAVIFPGRAEYAEKYGPVVTELVARGFAVATVDWRGQGLSDRNHTRPMLGHVEDFRDYQLDVAALMAHADDLGLPEPRYMLAHSMGGCIGLRSLVDLGGFQAAILSAPMWRLQMRAVTRELTNRVTRVARMVGMGGRRTPFALPRPSTLAVPFAVNALTSDRGRFERMVAQITAHPDLALAGPSVQWTYAALEEMSRLHRGPLPRIPVLVFLGSDETVVSPGVIRAQVAKMPAARLVDCPGARHEIFMETPPTLERVWREIDAFLADCAEGGAAARSGFARAG